MKIIERQIIELIPADYNPRKKSEHVLSSIKSSLKDYGWLAPVVVNKHKCDRCGDRSNIIVGGHRRLEAAQANNEFIVPTIEVDLHIEDEKRANLRLNAQEKFDEKGLAEIVSELHTLDSDKAATLGFSGKELADLLYKAKYLKNNASGILAEKFLIPPFSVVDAKQGEWQTRKKAWLELLGDLAESRVGTLAKGERNLLMMYGSGVSSFDPVLSEIAYSWFLPEGGKRILDPFAGSLGRGGVAAVLGHDYTGIEIRPEQVQANEKKLATIEATGKARFITGDAKDLEKLVPPEDLYDLIFTCPPYYDLEIYSGDNKDLSAKQTYEEFIKDYKDIFRQAASRLKDNRFAIVVVGDVRDENGFYRNFVRDNIDCFEELGFKLYNEMIYLQMLATAPHRAERNMRKRKVVKTHQNIFTFYKGDPKLIQNPQLLDVHLKVLTFIKGSAENIQAEYKNPPPIKRDVFASLAQAPADTEAAEAPGDKL